MKLNIEIIKKIQENPSIVFNMFKNKGYKLFEKGYYNVNNFGIRISTEGGDFDDIIGTVFYEQNNKGERVLSCLAFVGTTDPGNHYLQKPLNEDGCAILVPGQYFGFEIQKHRSQYDALCQRGLVKVYRDNNKNDIIEMDSKSIQEDDNFGINIHKTAPKLQTEMINKNSAGCQVFFNSADYDGVWMPLQYKSSVLYGNKFTYTLFELVDFAITLSDFEAKEN
jgi:hypothetical protein